MTYDEIIEQLEITKSKIKEIARNEYGGESWNDDLDALTEAADIVADYSKATAQASEILCVFKGIESGYFITETCEDGIRNRYRVKSIKKSKVVKNASVDAADEEE